MQVSDRASALLSPDGDYVVYNDRETNDLWLADESTGHRTNLTNTPDDSECCFGWLTGRPEVVVFSSKPRELAPVSWTTGFLGVVGADGSGGRMLDDQHHTAGLPATSPDGRYIAYGGGTVGWLYSWETGPEAFRPSEHGLDAVDGELAIGAPAWSPDGRRLSWVVDLGDANPDGRIGIGVFDLKTHTARVLHPYRPPGLEGWLPAPIWGPNGHLNTAGWVLPPIWSPGGQWLTFVTLAQDPAERELWVVRADENGDDERYLGPGRDPVWSPNGRWLAFSDVPLAAAECWIVELATWRAHPLALPPGAELEGWIDVGS